MVFWASFHYAADAAHTLSDRAVLSLQASIARYLRALATKQLAEFGHAESVNLLSSAAYNRTLIKLLLLHIPDDADQYARVYGANVVVLRQTFAVCDMKNK
ncbi:hypothetical protein VU08_07090 [Desulfobulbus sp. F5]|nr:hypothetical protein [Desulfobulbus sp. F5]